MKQLFQQKSLYISLTIASIIGFLASFLQMLEKIALLENPNAVLTCNINSIFSCSNILNVWQSSVFGFPNSLMCIIFFVIMLTIGIVGWSGGSINNRLRFTLQGFTLFFIGFGFWYLWQSIFVVSSLCVYCMFCYAAVLVISGAWFRLNYKDLRVSKNIRQTFERMVANKTDILIWSLIAIVIIIEMLIKFAWS